MMPAELACSQRSIETSIEEHLAKMNKMILETLENVHHFEGESHAQKLKISCIFRVLSRAANDWRRNFLSKYLRWFSECALVHDTYDDLRPGRRVPSQVDRAC